MNKSLTTKKAVNKELKIFNKFQNILGTKIAVLIIMTALWWLFIVCLIGFLYYLKWWNWETKKMLTLKEVLEASTFLQTVIYIFILFFIVFLFLAMEEYFLGMKLCLIDSDFNKIAKPILVFNLISAFVFPFMHLISWYLLLRIFWDSKIDIEQKLKDHIEQKTEKEILIEKLQTKLKNTIYEGKWKPKI